jgi:hypothetical protein
MGQVLSLPFNLMYTTLTYYRGFFYYLLGPGRTLPYYSQSNVGDVANTIRPLMPLPTDTKDVQLFKQHARIHLFNLASNFYLYKKPHYRKDSYRADLLDNLRNVAIPGTGKPLAWMAQSRLAGLFALCVVNPLVCGVASFHAWLASRGRTSLRHEYATRLLAPDDWFHYWRLNCNVVALHSYLHNMPSDYSMENKWTFLETGERLGIPVSPFLTCPGLVVKHRNEEGGMGIFFYKNATVGGDWILQERIDNSDWVASLLPPNAPLSTFRIITCSRALDPSVPVDASKDISSLACVFRAGRAGAATDHDSILFDVDIHTGLLRGGTTNAHWYRLGCWKALTCPWRSYDEQRVTHHPDGVHLQVAGHTVPNILEMKQLVETAHAKLCPHVPLAGWDVVASTHPERPLCLLEVNLSCNFFRGSFDPEVCIHVIIELIVVVSVLL